MEGHSDAMMFMWQTCNFALPCLASAGGMELARRSVSRCLNCMCCYIWSYDNGNESTYVVHSKVVFKLFSSIIINSLLVNNGLNSTVHICPLFRTEQTLLNVIAWVRSKVSHLSRRACTDLLIKTCMMRLMRVRTTYVRLFIGCLVGRYDLIYWHV